MLLPPELASLSAAVTSMATTREAAAVGRALRRLLGTGPGVVELLAIRTGWVAEFEVFSEIARASAPLTVPPREARALAGTVRGLYLPGVGALLNGALIGGTTRLALAGALAEPETRTRLLLHLTHEVAGHGYLAENTPLGRRHVAGATRRSAVSFAGRFLPLGDHVASIDAASRESLEGCLACSEGWARWVTDRLRPLLAEELPDLAPTLAADPTPEARRERDRLAADTVAAQLPVLNDDEARELLLACARRRDPVPSDSIGLALFRATASAAGDAACISAVHAACRAPEGASADLLLWRAARSAVPSSPAR